MYLKKFINSKSFVLLLFLLLTALFFHKTFISGKVPFPGDILVSEYSPWKYSSFLGYNPGSYPNKAQYFDTIRQIYPWKEFSINLLKSGQMPLWNPYNFSGTPLLANSQSSPFYPLNIIFFLFEFVNGWTIFIILQPLLALYFTYIYLREISLSKKASIFASIGFGFSLFMIVFLEYGNIGHAFLWLPLILFGIEKYFKEKKWSIFVILIGIFSSATAGHIQIFSYLLVFSVAYALIRLITLRAPYKKIFLLITIFIFSIGACAMQLLPTFELISLSARSTHDYNTYVTNFLIQINQLILFISPDFFGNPAVRNYLLPDSYPGNALYAGFAVFIFFCYGLFSFKKNTFVKLFTIFFFSILLFVVRNPFSEFIYSLDIPIISSSSPSNGIFLLVFCMSVVSAFGFDELLKLKKIKKIIPLFFIFLILMLLEICGRLDLFIYSEKNLLLSVAIFLACAIVILSTIFLKSKKIILLILPILIIDLFFYFSRFNAFVSKEIIYPKTEIVDKKH